jgi:hypothetical protein
VFVPLCLSLCFGVQLDVGEEYYAPSPACDVVSRDWAVARWLAQEKVHTALTRHTHRCCLCVCVSVSVCVCVPICVGVQCVLWVDGTRVRSVLSFFDLM